MDSPPSFTEKYVPYAFLVVLILLAMVGVRMLWPVWLFGAYLVYIVVNWIIKGPGCIDCAINFLVVSIVTGIAYIVFAFDIGPVFHIGLIMLVTIYWITRYSNLMSRPPSQPEVIEKESAAPPHDETLPTHADAHPGKGGLDHNQGP
jgi:hypothetical protein